MPIIEVKNLVKKFSSPDKKEDLTAVDNVSFSVDEGEVFGLVGPNGAGKTTTLEIIECLQKPTSGETIVAGFNSQKQASDVKKRIGVQLQSAAYFDFLKLGEILDLFGSFYQKKVDVDKLLKIVELKEKKNSMVKHLSGGQKQRFSICTSLVNDPEIVFLDEPTTGLDPQARQHLWRFIKKINKQNKTIVLTTHYMEEAQFLCHRVGIMDLGKIVVLDTPRNLISELKTTAKINFASNQALDIGDLKRLSNVLGAKSYHHNSYSLSVHRTSQALQLLYSYTESKEAHLENLEVISANLEDVFLELTGKKLRE